MATPYQPDIEAVGDSIFLTAMVSIIPLLVVFVLLGFLKVKAHIAGLAGLASAILVAILAFGMPVDLSLLAASQGVSTASSRSCGSSSRRSGCIN